MFICQFGMHNSAQGHRNANVCKQTYDACCSVVVSSLYPKPVPAYQNNAYVVTAQSDWRNGQVGLLYLPSNACVGGTSAADFVRSASCRTLTLTVP